MSERFYTNCPLQVGSTIELVGAEAHHLSAVCRFRPGDAICLFNGDGHEYPSHITDVGRRQVLLLVNQQESSHRELPFTLEVAVPLPKGDRGQFLVEKLTEIGVTSFVPLRSRRSVVHPGDSKLEKLQRHVIEASKQCGRNVLMHIAPLQDWSTFCVSPKNGLRIVAHPNPQAKGDQSLGGDLLLAAGLHPLPPGTPLTVAVGPEGGFTEEEVTQSMAAGWQVLDLGPRILRVETAAMVLAAWASGGFFHGQADGKAAKASRNSTGV